MNRRNYNRPAFSGMGLGIDRKYKIGGGIIVALILVCIGVYVYMADVRTHTVTFVFESKERVVESDGNNGVKSSYRIFTEEGEAYEVGDNLLHGHFDSSNLYARFKQGHTYECEATGWRIPIFSTYENLIGCKELK